MSSSTNGVAAFAGSESSSFFFGWDLLYQTVERIVNKNDDIVIVLAHFVLIKHCNFRCLGLGDDKTATDADTGSELLPAGWNDDDHKYTIRYKFNNQVYLLFAHKTHNCLILNLLDVNTKQVSNISLEPDALVVRRAGSIRDIMPTSAEIATRIRKELAEPVFAGTTREITTQTTTTGHNSANSTHNTHNMATQPEFIPMNGGWHPMANYGPPPRPVGWPDDVGRGDLDPLGRGGQGNIMPFPSAPDFRNEVRPRFDPYGAPETNFPAEPDPDNLQPPGFGGHNYYT